MRQRLLCLFLLGRVSVCGFASNKESIILHITKKRLCAFYEHLQPAIDKRLTIYVFVLRYLPTNILKQCSVRSRNSYNLYFVMSNDVCLPISQTGGPVLSEKILIHNLNLFITLNRREGNMEITHASVFSVCGQIVFTIASKTF